MVLLLRVSCEFDSRWGCLKKPRIREVFREFFFNRILLPQILYKYRFTHFFIKSDLYV